MCLIQGAAYAAHSQHLGCLCKELGSRELSEARQNTERTRRSAGEQEATVCIGIFLGPPDIVENSNNLTTFLLSS